MFRRGIHASLAADPALSVRTLAEVDASHDDVDLDVVVASPDVARAREFSCPVVLCDGEEGGPALLPGDNAVVGVLRRSTLTEAQLHAAVRAAAAGLRINTDGMVALDAGSLDPRAVRVLQLLAEGCSTREIATELNFSERTIKKAIHEIGRQLKARSRAHVVARAIRQGII